MSLRFRNPQINSLTIVLSLILTAMSLFSVACVEKTTKTSPNILLWAWEREENLEFLDPTKFGVAFLAQTIILFGDNVDLKPRRQPLKTAPNAYVVAVTRIETSKAAKNSLSQLQKEQIVSFIKKTLELPNVKEIQIDFDAALSERQFYRQVLNDLRSRLPAGFPLRMTALASWCIGDTWIKDLPVDSAIPMAFDMGADDEAVRKFLQSGNDWNEQLCKKDYGISIDQPLNIDFRTNRNFYIFKSSLIGWISADLARIPKGVIQ